MDRWFLYKDLFQWLTSNNFDWVTKCKRNTALYELSGYDWNNNPHYSPVKPAILIARVYQKLIKAGKGGECVSISIPDIYIKLPVMKENKKGKLVKKQIYTSIAVVVVIRLPEDIDQETCTFCVENPDEKAAHFKGAYLLISNRADAPEQSVQVYAKRWKIEIFYLNSKQELGLTSCHAQSKVAHESHIEMIFLTETILNYANWELNKDGAIPLTHCEMIRGVINAKHRTCIRKNTIQLYFATTCTKFPSVLIFHLPETKNSAVNKSGCCALATIKLIYFSTFFILYSGHSIKIRIDLISPISSTIQLYIKSFKDLIIYIFIYNAF